MTLVIHCTREQVTYIACTPGIGKLHIERNGTRTLLVPRWIEVMYKYAKVHEFRELYHGSRYITHPTTPQRNIMKNIIVIISCLILSSCMSYNIQLRNPEGKTYFCKGSGFGIIGVPIAYANKDECITKAEAKGYVKQGE